MTRLSQLALALALICSPHSAIAANVNLTGKWTGTATGAGPNIETGTFQVSASVTQTANALTLTVVFTGPGDVAIMSTQTAQINGTSISFGGGSDVDDIQVTGTISSNGMSGTGQSVMDTETFNGSFTLVGSHLSGSATGSEGDTLTWSLDGTSQPPPEPGKDLGSDCPGSCTVGNPVDVGTGNKFEQVADYETAGQNKLSFTRYYNSRGTFGPSTLATTLGKNWSSTYDRYLMIVSASSISVERADGQILGFNLNGGRWTSDSDVDLELTQSGSTWTLKDSSETVEIYSTVSTTEAKLTSITARNGFTETLQYNSSGQLESVTDSFNRRLNFTYQKGLLQTVSTPDGLVLTYNYTSSGVTPGVLDRLASVMYSTSPQTRQTYLYENVSLPFALTGITDENGNRYATWAYDVAGRATSSQHGKGIDLTTVAYDDSTGNRTVTNALGVSEIYKFKTLQGVPKITEIDRKATSTTSSATRFFTYDTNGYTASQTDWNGNKTSYVNDVHGQPTTITEPTRTTTISYDPTFVHLPHQIVTTGLTTTFGYDGSGNLLTRTETDTTTQSVPYATKGTTRIWKYTWQNGLIASVQTPRTDVKALTSFTYDSSGALTQMTNALSQKTEITQHTGGGLPLTIVDPNNVTTMLAYDGRLHLHTATVKTAIANLTTTYNYDPAGNLTSVQLPDGSRLTNSYDGAHRLTRVSDLFNQSIAYTLDALGDQKLINISDSTNTVKRKHSGVFDALGRILRDIGSVNQTTVHTYDNNGNALTITDPLTNKTAQAFDALNRLNKVTDPAPGGITNITFDTHDRPLTVTAPNGAKTSYVYDGFGDVIQKTSPDTGATVYHYDLDGNLAQSHDATGAVANYSYDALGRVLSTTYPSDSAENVTYTYDQTGHGFGIGRLTSVTDAAGALSRSYDERGNLLSETRTRGTVTLKSSYNYDAASRVASITYPSRWLIAYTRDAMGRVTGVTAKKPGGTAIAVASNVTYEPFGPVTGMKFGNGVTEAGTFDLDYRLQTLTDTGTTALLHLTYGYDADSNVKTIADAVAPANSQTLGYDPLSRLNSATGGYGSVVYTYDQVGNRLTEKRGTVTTNYGYKANTDLLETLTIGTTTTEIFGYSAAGNINNFNPGIMGAGSSPITGLKYNQANRLATVLAGTSTVAAYTYDASGQRIVKATGMTTLYEYDRNGHLLEEASGNGVAQVDYVYLDGMPVATVAPATGKLYFIHNDRLGTPLLATDSSQAIAWQTTYQPFGTTGTVSGLITQNLRLPGQQFDAETGFSHNGFREYIPNLGRYLESDPIGVRGGLNLYAYVHNSPVRYIDPLGLQEQEQEQLSDFGLFPGEIPPSMAQRINAEWEAVPAAYATVGVTIEGVATGVLAAPVAVEAAGIAAEQSGLVCLRFPIACEAATEVGKKLFEETTGGESPPEACNSELSCMFQALDLEVKANEMLLKSIEQAQGEGGSCALPGPSPGPHPTPGPSPSPTPGPGLPIVEP